MTNVQNASLYFSYHGLISVSDLCRYLEMFKVTPNIVTKLFVTMKLTSILQLSQFSTKVIYSERTDLQS